MPAHPAVPQTGPVTGHVPLNTGESFVVWAVQHWVRTTRDNQDPMPTLMAGFDQAGLADEPTHGALLFDEIMTTFAVSKTSQTLRAGCARCTQIGDAERILLACLAFHQARQLQVGEKVLSAWFPSAAVRLITQKLDRLAVHMTKRGLQFRVHDFHFDMLAPARTPTQSESVARPYIH